ncbi:DUF4920 domain-containing protein [Muriicola sp. Z0-33]|uniref:DUF4920 domain-containing protein n=1 Tax=Muriicola sp. Z0-33 TaxID=2816957 RepID=UPI0022380B01|nr:DUF4920 domain-containing protein [Muriicola sp. Z0-33]MCW5517578.1 DUF4920 domain-containing protein [Muriicola sp. Z0-33]
MKSFNIFLVFLVVLVSCKPEVKADKTIEDKPVAVKYTAVGKQIDDSGAQLSVAMTDTYKGLQVSDTLKTKFKAEVIEVCQAKGCWMKVQLEDGQETMVRFKDYGFFVPKDIAGKEVVLNGLAFVEEMSVEDQRHYAKDAGKSDEEIAQITAPKKTFGFEADGLLILN